MAEIEEKSTVLAICYDFDKTLSPNDMQAQGFIQTCGYTGSEVKRFWAETNTLASENEMDSNLAYMYMMINKSRGKIIATREKLMEYGSKVELFPGVDTWFRRINSYGKKHNIQVEHYIISSGLKEMIEGSSIAKEFRKIYACSFYFDSDGVAVWPAQTVNYTSKTQFLFRIEKDVLDITDNEGVNRYIEPDKLRVPFRNMVYIGDSETDIPCMKLVNLNGGHSIGVYNPEMTGRADKKQKSRIYEMMRDNRIRYFSPADYTAGSDLENLVKDIINKTEDFEKLEKRHISNARKALQK